MAMNMSTRDRRALILGAAGAALIIGYLYAIDPALAWYQGLQSSHAATAEQLAREAYEAQERVYDAGRVAEYEKKYAPLEQPKPYSEEVTRLGARIVAAAQESGVELKGSTSSAPVPFLDDSSLDQVNFLIDLSCQWEQFFKFVDAMHKTSGVLSVEQASLNGDPKKGGKLDVKLTVSVLVKAAPRNGGGGWQ